MENINVAKDRIIEVVGRDYRYRPDDRIPSRKHLAKLREIATRLFELIEKHKFEDGEIYALRGDNVIVKNKFRRSFQSPDGERKYRLNGVSAIFLSSERPTLEMIEDALTSVHTYGDNIYLLKGEENDELGNDIGEIILSTHKILSRIDQKEPIERYDLLNKYYVPLLENRKKSPGTFKDYVESKGYKWDDYDYAKHEQSPWKELINKYNKLLEETTKSPFETAESNGK